MADNQGPRTRSSRKPSGIQNVIDINDAQVSFDKEAFTNLILSHGVKVTHYRAIPDPTGMASRGNNHPSLSSTHSSDGFIYEEAGTCSVFFSTNSMNEHQQPEGVIESSSAYVTLPDKYDNCDKPVLIAPWDRFFLKDIEVRVVGRQFVEANSTGIDRLQYPATCVEFVQDANGVRYEENKHYEITPKGDIKWISQTRPSWNPEIGKGTVYSIRYRYTPFFVVAKLIHEIRVSQVTDLASYERKLERMPYQALVMRENVFHDRNRDSMNPSHDGRGQDGPASGGMLGPVG